MEINKEKYLGLNKNINRGFRELRVWREASDLYSFVKKKLEKMNSISFKVKAQIEDSVFSVSSNIAEGYCRRYLKENIQFNSVALSSLGENYSQVFTLFNANEIDEKWFQEYDSRHYSVENKLIKLNKSFIQKIIGKEEWKSDYKIKEILEPYLQ